MPRGRTSPFQRASLIALIAIAMSVGLLSTPAHSEATAAAPTRSAAELASQDRSFETNATPGAGLLTADDEKFLDDLERRGIAYFIETADPVTGLMPDRAEANGAGKDVASIASVGFGLSALCIGDERGWIEHQDAYNRALRVLRFLRDKAPQEHGHFYHFLNMRTGEREWKCEVSNIDTALLMCGVLTVRQHFASTELSKLANELYERVDWPWLLTKDGVLCMGWIPEHGFIEGRWDQYNEGLLIYLLGIGSKTHPLPVESWRAWKRQPVVNYGGVSFVQCPPLFTHQYPQTWFDLRDLRDEQVDYFRNAQLATLANRQWCLEDLARTLQTYRTGLWGITASDTAKGYQAWGGPPMQGEIDGSVVPCAAGGSLVFEPRICLDVLKEMRDKHGERGYLKYGFVDALNPVSGWYNADVLGIDVGVTILMAENCRTGFVWKSFMSSDEARTALARTGFRRLSQDERASLAVTSMLK